MSPEQWRKANNLSQDAVARMIGLTGKNPARTWQRWESGERQPPLTVIAKIEVLSDGAVNTTSWIKLRSTREPLAMTA